MLNPDSDYLRQITIGDTFFVRNCGIGVSIKVGYGRLREAIQYGCLNLQLHNSYYGGDFGHDGNGCGYFSTEDAVIYYNEEGEPVDYELSYTDSDQILNFQLLAGLVRYDSNPNDTTIGLVTDHEGKWGDMIRNFGDLLHKSSQANRRVLPPTPIMVRGEAHEVSAFWICKNPACVTYLGDINAGPLPFRKR